MVYSRPLMNVDRMIFDEIRDELHQYDCSPREVEDYINTPSYALARATPQLVSKMLTKHRKEPLLPHMEALLDIERRTRLLLLRHRDHVGHMFSTFLLGILINEKLLIPPSRVDPFQWELASLFHDVGYPLEISHTIDDEFIKTINQIKRDVGIQTDDIVEQTILNKLIDLQNGNNALDIIQHRLDSWKLPIDTRQSIQAKQVDHGIMSALVILYAVDLLYQHNNAGRVRQDIIGKSSNVNWNQDYFLNDIINACSAMFIHNLPQNCFGDVKIKLELAPLAYLLFLADNLQEWKRPSPLNRFGYSPTLFEIRVEQHQLIVKVPTPAMRSEITEKLSNRLDPFPVMISSLQN